MSNTEPMVWFAMRATYGRNLEAKKMLDETGVESYIPMHHVISLGKGGRKIKKYVPVVRDLVFVRTTKDGMLSIKESVDYLRNIYIPTAEGKKQIVVVPDQQMDSFMMVAGAQNEGIMFFSPDEINGSGTVDLTAGVTFSWQVSGDSPMTAYQITFYQNNAASTQIATTGKVTLGTPFWGVNYKGQTVFYSVTLAASFFSAASMSNGNEYKFTITQWYGSGASDYITQQTASLMACRSAPSVSINAIPNPLTSRSYSIKGTYTQAQNDAVQYVRWQIATADAQDEPFLDTGRIRGTGELQVDYDGFFTGTTYSVKLTVETVMGVSVDTGWVDFAVSYAVSEPQGQVQACQLADDTHIRLIDLEMLCQIPVRDNLLQKRECRPSVCITGLSYYQQIALHRMYQLVYVSLCYEVTLAGRTATVEQ